MSEIKTGRLDQYGAEPLKQQHSEQLALKGLKLKLHLFQFVVHPQQVHNNPRQVELELNTATC